MTLGRRKGNQDGASRRVLWVKMDNRRQWCFWALAICVCWLSFCLTWRHQLRDSLKVPLFWSLDLRAKLDFCSHLWYSVVHWRFSRPPQLGLGDPFKYALLWMAPFLSGGGYSSEAISYAEAIVETKLVPQFKIMQHGDLYNHAFVKGLPGKTKETLFALLGRDIDVRQSVVICHSEPGAWNPPLFQTTPCPPSGYEDPAYVIGRTMFETDKVNPDHVRRLNRMDEIWVPSQFHMESFRRSGVEASKLIKLPQIVDVHFFDPAHVEPAGMPAGKCLYGDCEGGQSFVFLSIFKWEMRKGWDILLKAYMQEFTGTENVALYLLTNRYHSDGAFDSYIENFVQKLGDARASKSRPTLYLLDKHVSQTMLPGLYQAADAFVLPSRGEGWGRPLVEAMAMGLPVIATNWSGMTEYMTEANSYPLPIAGMVQVEDGPFKGHQWAEPSLESLQILMRHVFSNPAEARAKGLAGRATMVSRYSPEVIGQQLASELTRVQYKLESKAKKSFCAINPP